MLKIAFISTSLDQGGSQRFIYEHAVEFKKKGHKCVVITQKSQQGIYVEKLKNSEIQVLGAIGRRIELSKFGWNKLIRLMRLIFSLFDYYRINPSKYDAIIINQIETYHLLRAFQPFVKKSIVLMMSHKHQYAYDIYYGIKENIKTYLIDEKQKTELENSGVIFDYIQYPLSINLNAFEPADYTNNGKELAYFARLSVERPIEPIFFALHILKKRRPDVVLHMFGSGELTFEQHRIFKILGLSKNVIFEGHAPSIEDAIRDKRISVVWGTSDGNTLGYSTIEIMAHRVPLLLWNLDPFVLSNKFSSESDFEQFANKTIKTLEDPEYAQALIEENYKYISDNCDISKNSNLLLNFIKNI